MLNKELIIKHIGRNYNPRDIGYKDIILLSNLFNIHENSMAKLIDYNFKLGFRCYDILDAERNRWLSYDTIPFFESRMYGNKLYGNSNIKKDNSGFYKI